MQATKEQKQLIHINTPNRDTKEEFVQWATDDNAKTSCNDLSFDEANKILLQLNLTPHKPKNYAVFDKNNKQHRTILSLCIQNGFSKAHPKYGRVADLEALNTWMHSAKCPVQKPLKKMEPKEVSRIIGALSAMAGKKYK